jgi:glycosyltransferase involved in cell wall biosynthesis
VNVLFIHQNFPGQFVHLAGALAREKGNRVVALTIHKQPAPQGVEVRPYTLLRSPVPETHFLLKETESKILRAEACAAAAMKLKHEGFIPDVIVAHPGWGEAMFIKDVFPTAKLVVYCEYYYAAEGQDVGFDPELPPINFAQRCQLRMKNTANLHSLEIADAAISPTEWQKSTFPKWAQSKIKVIHDGIDFTKLRYQKNSSVSIPKNATKPAVTLKCGDEVLTYVARNLEPTRGFQVFMRALPKVLETRPNAHVLILGGNGLGYGARPPNKETWFEQMMDEVGCRLDLKRVHFLGKTSYDTYVQALHVSRVHTYLTIPFVLSWSFLEAYASGVPIIASKTQPVLEYSDYEKIDLCSFFDVEEWAKKISTKLKKTDRRTKFIGQDKLEVRACVNDAKNYLQSIY